MQKIAAQAKVSMDTFYAMFLGKAVEYSDAVAVLNAFSAHVVKAWLIEDTSVPTTPDDES